MNNLRKALEALEKLSGSADRLVPLVLSFAVLAGFVVIGLQSVGK